MDDVELAFISILLMMIVMAVGLVTVAFVYACDFGDWLADMMKRYRHGRR